MERGLIFICLPQGNRFKFLILPHNYYLNRKGAENTKTDIEKLTLFCATYQKVLSVLCVFAVQKHQSSCNSV